MATTRDDVIADITSSIKEVIPDNIELDGDDLDTIQSAVEGTLTSVCEAIDQEDETEEPAIDTEGSKR